MLRVKQEQIGRGKDLLLASTQINRMETAANEWKGPILRFQSFGKRTAYKKKKKSA